MYNFLDFWIFKLLLLICYCDSLCAEINMLNACTLSPPSQICVYVLTVYTLHILINLQLLWLDSTYKKYYWWLLYSWMFSDIKVILYSIKTSYKCSYYSALYSLRSWTYVIIIIKPCNSKSKLFLKSEYLEYPLYIFLYFLKRQS